MDLLRIAARVAAGNDLQSAIGQALSQLGQPVNGSPKGVDVPGFDDLHLTRFDPRTVSPTWGELQLMISLRGNLKTVYHVEKADDFDTAAAARAATQAMEEHADVLKPRTGWIELTLQYDTDPGVDDDGTLSSRFQEMVSDAGGEVSQWESDAMHIEVPADKLNAVKQLLEDVGDGSDGPEMAALISAYNIVDEGILEE